MFLLATRELMWPLISIDSSVSLIALSSLKKKTCLKSIKAIHALPMSRQNLFPQFKGGKWDLKTLILRTLFDRV